MTAEIAIINKQGIALAADSAVTIGSKRVWQNANKLFSLSPHNDIGIMIYGRGDFNGFPWETIIKSFRKSIGPQKFATVAECAASLIAYLESDKIHDAVMEKISASFLFLQQIIKMRDAVGEYKSETEFQQRVSAYANTQMQEIKKHAIILKGIKVANFSSNHKGTIDELFKEKFSKKSTSEASKVLLKLCYEAYRRKIASGYHTGLVVAGFGETEFFPALQNYIVDGKHKTMTRVWQNESCDLNAPGALMARVMPFAQSDMFRLFLEGILPHNERFVLGALSKILDEKSTKLIKSYVTGKSNQTQEMAKSKKNNRVIITKFIDAFKEYRTKAFVQEIMGVVATLPKEEMAAMAEALVELTSLRRKIDSSLQSVGGPTDVAIISKGDGFIWIKRKHYFNLELNRDFMPRKALQYDGGQP